MRNLIKLPLLLLTATLSAQLSYSGELNPNVMTRTSDQSQINLPYRLLSLDLGYTLGNWDLKTNSAIEYRNQPSESVFDLREMYLAYFPDWGEVKIGKQIHAWGSADGNNPTDNLNPYDYYYLFEPGVGKKIGTFSFSTKIYYGNYQLEGVITPQFKSNRYPYGEKDYPISIPEKPEIEYPVQDELELGFRVQTTIGESDFGFSVFKGNDRAPSLATLKYYPKNDNQPDSEEQIIPQLGYRTTTVWGLDMVTFVGNFSIRGEGAIFKTQSPLLKLNLFKIPTNLYELHQEVTYSQYVFQVEYIAASGLTISGQLLGNKVSNEHYDWFHTLSQELVTFDPPKFQPGMGTPFAMFSDQSFMVSTSGTLMNGRMEWKGATLLDLDKEGQMINGSVNYSPWENWKFEMVVALFSGDKDDPENKLGKMESFSHLKLGVSFNF